MRTSFVIPCYNEEDSIAQLCDRLRDVIPRIAEDGPVEIIIVNDGSTDKTEAQVHTHGHDLPIRILRHHHRQGLGAALRTGLGGARGSEIVTLDSDCTYDPAEVPQLLDVLRDGANIVAGSPYHPDGEVVGVAPWRLLLSRTISWIYAAILPVKLYTYTSIFRAYQREVLQDIDKLDDGFLSVTQLIVEPILRGVQVHEVPATLRTRRYGESKIRVFWVGMSHLRYLAHIIARRLFMRAQTGAQL